jgi:hypothetical protein
MAQTINVQATSVISTSPYNFDVDIVFTWVDGSDPKHIEARQRFLVNNERSKHKRSTHVCRWRDSGEIEQAIQSIKLYAPWVRNIYIVTGLGQRPKIPHYDKIKYIDHVDIFGTNASALPVFNSHAIEANLCHIQGLAERFIYFNDDMFLGAPLRKEQCFNKNGQFILLSTGSIDRGPINRRMAAWWNSRRNTGNLIARRFGERQRPATHHQARPLLKSVCMDAWSDEFFRGHLNRVSRTRFRTCEDIDPINLFSLYGLETRRAQVGHLRGLVLSMGDNTNINMMANQLNGRFTMYCINDDMMNPRPGIVESYEHFLRTRLPHHKNPHNKNNNQRHNNNQRQVSGPVRRTAVRAGTLGRGSGPTPSRPVGFGIRRNDGNLRTVNTDLGNSVSRPSIHGLSEASRLRQVPATPVSSCRARSGCSRTASGCRVSRTVFPTVRSAPRTVVPVLGTVRSISGGIL